MNKTINQLTNLTEISSSDELPIWDSSASDTKKVSVENLGKEIIKEFNTYSTTEYFTGKYWIDGKPIYGIVLEGTSLPSSGTVFLTGIERLINQYGSYVGGGNQVSMPYNSGSTKVELRVNSSNQLFLQLASVSAVTKYYFYAEYTKTTT